MNEINEGKEKRIALLAEHEKEIGMPAYGPVRWSFIQYDRYHEAGGIIQELEKRGIFWPKVEVVDYGCGVGDYGFAFGRQGAFVLFYDIDVLMPFLTFRLKKEPSVFGHMTMTREIVGEIVIPPIDRDGVRIAIFGEVLEHMDHPLQILTNFHNAGTKYIFTSSYPYRSDDPENDYWHESDHKDTARIEQPACRNLLETNYNRIANFGGQQNLWERKP